MGRVGGGWCRSKVLSCGYAVPKNSSTRRLRAERVGALSYYGRWIAAFDNILFAERILTPSELAAEMDEVAARWDQEPRP